MEIRYTRLFSLPEYRYFVCIRSSSLLLNIFRTYFLLSVTIVLILNVLASNDWISRVTYSIPNKNTQSLIFLQFWWVFRNSRFFLNSSCRDILQVLCILCIWMYCYLRATTREVPLNYRTPQHFKKKPGCSLLGEPKLNKCWCFPSQVTFKCQRPIKKIALLFYARKGI